MFAVMFSTGCFAQIPDQLGIGLTTDKDQRVQLSYTLSTDRNYSLNFKISQGWQVEDDFAGSNYSAIEVFAASKSEVLDRKIRNYESKFFFGPEFQIKESSFNWGVEAIIGYRVENTRITKTTFDFEYLSTNPVVISTYIPAESIETWLFDRSDFLVTGIQGRFSVRAAASEKIGLNIFGEIGIEYRFHLSDSIYTAFEDSGFEPPDYFIQLTFPKSYFVPRLRLGATLSLLKPFSKRRVQE